MNRSRFLKLTAISSLTALVAGPVASAAEKATGPTQFRAYVGTYTGKKSQGIYMFTFNAATEIGRAHV